ncbi:MAG: c-type cytochrome biogenesis protein CcsB [Deltaproteobacteria bacterium]|nr:c-type cytochrome biogenesis protein CcsB [Deltaproteobacteria bacterium]
MTSILLFNITTVFLFAGMVLLFIYLACRKPRVFQAGFAAAIVSLGVLTAGIGLRWYESYQLLGEAGHAPLSNFYESMIFFSWTILLIYLIIHLRYRPRLLGALVLPLAFFALIGAQLSDASLNPLIPALKSNWLTYHVFTCFLGYAAFAIACCAAIAYLLKVHQEDSENTPVPGKNLASIFPPAQVLEEINYQAIMVGFLLLTLGIITGSAWAHRAWGAYWSWDPKETWSLIVWLIYAAFLHARISRGWTGRKIAWLSIAGFAATLFCYLGVNFLLSGLHSYGSM